MRYILTIIACLFLATACGQSLKKIVKFSTFYIGASGNNSLAPSNVYGVSNGLTTDVVETPFDYAITAGVRKIARFGYENRANAFYDGTEKSYSDAATIGKIKGFEFLSEVDWKRQQGKSFFNQDHFVRYVAKNWIAKAEYIEDNFADVKYFESSQRFRVNLDSKISINLGVVQRISEPYGYNPLNDWVLPTGEIHYTALALEEGYSVDVNNSEFFSPEGELVANSTEVWEAVVVPQMLSNYVSRKRSELPNQWVHSVVVGYDLYHYTDNFWLHSWSNVLPYHLDSNGEYSYSGFNDDNQWIDFSGGLIFGKRFSKSLGVYLEGKYNRYWDRQWYDFSVGLNYVIL